MNLSIFSLVNIQKKTTIWKKNLVLSCIFWQCKNLDLQLNPINNIRVFFFRDFPIFFLLKEARLETHILKYICENVSLKTNPNF